MHKIRSRISGLLRRNLPSGVTAPLIQPVIHGYVDVLSDTEVGGWMWNPYEPNLRIAFEVAVVLPDETSIIATGTADQFYPALRDAAVGDARYGFHIIFATPLSARQRNHLVVRPRLTKIPLERAPKFEGFVDELSHNHVAGWVRNRFDTEDRVAFEIVIAEPGRRERVLANGQASLLNLPLAMQAIGDGQYGFRVVFAAPLSESERDAVVVRAEAVTPVPVSPYLITAFEPIDHIAIDIVNNCNLRCPFCLFDYSETRTTRLMSTATFDGLLALLPFVRDGNFWLSCLHEPTLNPDFIGFIERVPRQWRRKLMFTTNLAKRMPDAYFQKLAASGISHINISLESLDPGIFERMRKGAKWPIFKENWDRLIAAWHAASAPPRLRYIIMAYRSNRDEIPELVKYLQRERQPWQIEVRHTYNALHIADDFREAEFLDDTDWAWLADQLGGYAVDAVMLIPPPEFSLKPSAPADDMIANAPAGASEILQPPPREPQPTEAAMAPMSEPAVEHCAERRIAQSAAERRLTQPFNLQIDWDGKLEVYGKWDNPPELKKFAISNINDLADPYAYLMAL